MFLYSNLTGMSRHSLICLFGKNTHYSDVKTIGEKYIIAQITLNDMIEPCMAHV